MSGVRIPTACVTTIRPRIWRHVICGRKTYAWLHERYRQPDHCTYPDALAGMMGCWSLMDAPWTRTPAACFYCDHFRGREKINWERTRAMMVKQGLLD
jgi:hypothetical protein